MSSAPSSDLRPASIRRRHLSYQTRIWGVAFLLASLAAVAVGQFGRQLQAPVWLRMMIFFFPPVIAMLAGGICLFSLGRDIVSVSGLEGGPPTRRRRSLMRDALHLGSPAWSAGFVVAAMMAASLVSLTQYAAFPLWLRVLIAVSPTVPLAMYLRSISRDTAKIDELALHVRRDAYGFVFCGMIGLFVCVHLLEKAGVVEGFRWSPTLLILTMFALLIVGAVISSRRFR